jgi:hypothetical protein
MAKRQRPNAKRILRGTMAPLLARRSKGNRGGSSALVPLPEPIVLTEIRESFIDRSVKIWGVTFSLRRGSRLVQKAPTIALEERSQARSRRRHRLSLFAIRFE